MKTDCGKIFLQKLYVNSEKELDVKLASPRFALANEIAHLQQELGYDQKQTAHALKIKVEDLLRLEDVDLTNSIEEYYHTIHKMQKLVSNHDVIFRNFILQYEQDEQAEKLPPNHYYRTYELFKKQTKTIKKELAAEIATLEKDLDLTKTDIRQFLNLKPAEYQRLKTGDQAIMAQRYFEIINQLYRMLMQREYDEIPISY